MWGNNKKAIGEREERERERVIERGWRVIGNSLKGRSCMRENDENTGKSVIENKREREREREREGGGGGEERGGGGVGGEKVSERK